jgi:hypothetical protein
MRFRPSALDQIAAMICGDGMLPFPYRTGNEIGRFFSGLGVDCVPQAGKSRNPWCLESVQAINDQSPEEGDSPSDEMRAIIEELMNPIYFEKSSKTEVSYEEALVRINRVLRQYNLEVFRNEKTNKAMLHSVDGSFLSTAIGAMEAVRKITFCPTVFQVPKAEVQHDLVAVMMPFRAEFDSVYAAIGSACESTGLRFQRADDFWANSAIMHDVFELLFVSFIVVVDFTGRNPNVMYETGIAHTLGKHVVPITQFMDDVPFDVRSHRVLRYHSNKEGLTKLQDDLAKRLTTIVQGHSWSA